MGDASFNSLFPHSHQLDCYQDITCSSMALSHKAHILCDYDFFGNVHHGETLRVDNYVGYAQ